MFVRSSINGKNFINKFNNLLSKKIIIVIDRATLMRKIMLIGKKNI